MVFKRCWPLLAALAAFFIFPASAEKLTVYSGRGKPLVDPLIEKFREATKIDVEARYGDSAEMAATIMEEGANSPADVFWSQDAGALGALAREGRLGPIAPATLAKVEKRFQSPKGLWIGTSGRARVLVYNTKALTPETLPDSILAFTDPKWKGRIGWAPTNASFQAFVTAMRAHLGEDKAREWLKGIIANEPKVYPRNGPIVEAAARGEIDAGFVNHYYLYRFLQEQGEGFAARNYFFKHGDPGSLVNVAGVGIVKDSKNAAAAARFVDFLLSEESQKFFATQDYEYPLAAGISADPKLTPLAQIDTPEIDLGSLSDLQGTLKLLREVGALE